MDPVLECVVDDIVEAAKLAASLTLLLWSIQDDTFDPKVVEVNVEQFREMATLVIVDEPKVVVSVAGLYCAFSDGGLGTRSRSRSRSSSSKQNGGSSELEKTVLYHFARFSQPGGAGRRSKLPIGGKQLVKFASVRKTCLGADVHAHFPSSGLTLRVSIAWSAFDCKLLVEHLLLHDFPVSMSRRPHGTMFTGETCVKTGHFGDTVKFFR